MVEEYEVVPITPLRKIEQRLERIEHGSPGYNSVLKDLAEMMKENQRTVDHLINTNAELITNISGLSNHLGALTTKFKEFMDSIEVSETSEEPEEWSKIKDGNKKLEETNQELLDKLKKLERKMKLASLSKYYYSSRNQAQPPAQQQESY